MGILVLSACRDIDMALCYTPTNQWQDGRALLPFPTSMVQLSMKGRLVLAI